MRWKVWTLALAVTGCASASAQSPAATPDWMSGYWLSCEGESEVAESWIGAGRGVLLGTNLTRGRGLGYEFLRIAPNTQGGLSYFSMPNGRAPPTEFAMTAHEAQRIVFENPVHDAPQRILYWREGDTLRARVEQLDGEGQMNWVFRRAEQDARCPH